MELWMEKSKTHMEPPKIQQHNTSGRMEDDIPDIDIANSDCAGTCLSESHRSDDFPGAFGHEFIVSLCIHPSTII